MTNDSESLAPEIQKPQLETDAGSQAEIAPMVELTPETGNSTERVAEGASRSVKDVEDVVAAHAGIVLARRRELLGLTESDVAARLKLSPKRVGAIESGSWDVFGSPVTLRGFVRAYAKVLGLDADAVAEMLPNLDPVTNLLSLEPTLSQPIGASPARRGLKVWISLPILGALALGLAIALGWVERDFLAGSWIASLKSAVVTHEAVPEVKAASDVSVQPLTLPSFGSNEGTVTKPSDAAPEAGQLPAPGPTQKLTDAVGAPGTASNAPVAIAASISNAVSTKPAAAGVPTATTANPALRLVFEQESWVEITAANGTVLMSGMVPGGAERVVDAGEGTVIVLGNAPVVKAFRFGKMLDLAPYTAKSVARFTLN